MGSKLFKPLINDQKQQQVTLEEATKQATLSADDIPSLNIIPHVIYATLSAHVYNNVQHTTPLPDGWGVFRTCASYNLDREGFFAIAYLHYGYRQCVIAERGTSEVLGLRAGVWVYFEKPTIQFYLAEQFSKQVRVDLSMVYGDDRWHVSYTGHSLGAVIASHRAVEENTFAVTFESPGAQEFINKISKYHTMNTNIVTYLRGPNPINTLRPHCGYLLTIPTPPVQLGGSSLILFSPPNSDMTELSDEEKSSTLTDIKQQPAAPPLSGGSTVSTGVIQSVDRVAASSSAAPAAMPVAPSHAAHVSATRLFMNSTSRFRIPSVRPQEYLRDYMLSGVGLGIPELQQYVSKVEPMVRVMLERTQQVHAVQNILEYFLKGDRRNDKEILRWPEHLMQFMEYCNTTRALEDPDNQKLHVKSAYRGLLQHLYQVRPRRRDRIAIDYVNQESVKLVRLWWAWEPAKRINLPFTLIEHKALNSIKIKDSFLISNVPAFSALKAKQFLATLVARSDIKAILASTILTSKGSDVVISKL
ncbi:unnamed protein product [Phytomonas sp. Hart1]|nr:unnamed protein product [Phytomonas sp. Hart1]|eukprot:CCW67330.1 unnamed protein product [Phytomonas sp. isolate Hart1]